MQELKSDENDKSEKGREGWVRVMSSVCMNGGGGGAWWFGRVDKETACGRLSASS